MKNHIRLIVFFTSVFIGLQAFGQVYSNKVVVRPGQDSAKAKLPPYKYIFPFGGKKATEKGFDLPLSAGVSVNYVWQRSELVINNLQLGFNNGQKVNLDEVIRFNSAISEASILNFRPDIWILPFLNVYGIFAVSKPSTNVDFGLWVPDKDGNWKEILKYNTVAKFNATSTGFGITPTIGVAGFFMALDMNCTWTDVDALAKPTFIYVFDPRVGKSFKMKKKDRALAMWVGGFRLKFSSKTDGNMNLSDVVAMDGSTQAKIDAAQGQLTQNQNDVTLWWESLTPREQQNPVNAAKYDAANKAYDKAGAFLDNAEGALSTAQSSTIQYSLDKKVKDMWNFLVGTQFQFSKAWMIRAEYGFLGTRQQALVSLQYRFGL